MIVLDANLLVRAVLEHRVRQILENYAGQGLTFCAPDFVFLEVQTHLPKLLEREERVRTM